VFLARADVEVEVAVAFRPDDAAADVDCGDTPVIAMTDLLEVEVDRAVALLA